MARRTEAMASKYEQLAAAVATGEPLTHAAARLKIGRRNAIAEGQTPEFKARVRAIREGTLKATADRLAALALQSTGVLHDLIRSKDENIRLRAAVEVMRSLVAVSNHVEMAERLTALEERLSSYAK